MPRIAFPEVLLKYTSHKDRKGVLRTSPDVLRSPQLQGGAVNFLDVDLKNQKDLGQWLKERAQKDKGDARVVMGMYEVRRVRIRLPEDLDLFFWRRIKKKVGS